MQQRKEEQRKRKKGNLSRKSRRKSLRIRMRKTNKEYHNLRKRRGRNRKKRNW